MTDVAVDASGFDLNSHHEQPHAFIQYKNTDICIDFRCSCGADCHFDGYFAYCVRCPHCQHIWQMPSILFPRDVTHVPPGEPYYTELAKDLEPDEDYSVETQDAEGFTVLKPFPVLKEN